MFAVSISAVHCGCLYLILNNRFPHFLVILLIIETKSILWCISNRPSQMAPKRGGEYSGDLELGTQHGSTVAGVLAVPPSLPRSLALL